MKREHVSGMAKLSRKTSTTSSKSEKESSKKEVKKERKIKDVKFPTFSEDDIIESEAIGFETVSTEFSATVSKIKSTMKQIINLKMEKLEDRDKLTQLRTEGCLNITSMKRLNRFSQICAKKCRENTKNMLQDSDSHFLKLQNLQYQAHHLKSEIEQCLGYNSLHKTLTLVDVDDFHLEAPDDIQDKSLGSDHELTKARLEWELMQRKQLQEKLDASNTNRENLDETANKKRTNLNDIRPQMQTILQAANNVRSRMGLGGVVGIVGEAASFLTEPLSTIYKAGIAYRQSNDDKLHVSIQGDEKEAIEMKEKGFENDENGERNESAEVEDGGRRSRRKKKSLKGWFPVWVEWTIGDKVVQFRHSTLNKQVYAESSKDVHRPELSGLYPSDAGVSDISTSNQFGRCYYWTAQLAGIADLPKGQSFSGFVSDLVDRIQMRFKNATLLNDHLATLTTKQLPVKFEDNVLMTGVFASFEPVVEFESARGLTPYEDGKVYQIEIEQKIGNKLIVLCSISPNYPLDAPRLSLTDSTAQTAATSSQLQHLEEYVNLTLPMKLKDSEVHEILSRQIASLLMQPVSAKVHTRNRFHPIRTNF